MLDIGNFGFLLLFHLPFLNSNQAWLFTPIKDTVVAEHRRCDPADLSWRAYPQDPTRFLLCDTGRRRYTVRQCPTLHGSRQTFDIAKKRCVVPSEMTDYKLMSTNEQRVGDTCYVNQDCADGMYCNNGVCACFLNYIEVNMKCIRVSTICAHSHFYAEVHTGKPRTCTMDIHCPVNFACEVHPGSPDINFCCYKSAASAASDVCGGTGLAYVDGNALEVMCSPDFPRVQCPPDYWCRYNNQLRRHYCCLVGSTDISSDRTTTSPTQSTTTSTSQTNGTTAAQTTMTTASAMNDTVHSSFGIEKVLGQTVQLAELVCGPGLSPWVFEGFPMPCNPLPPGVCPPGYLCKSINGSRLHFCCNDPEKTVPATEPSTSMSSARSSGSTPSSTSTFVNVTTPNLVCPNSAPYLLQGQPLICIGSDSRSCPQNYTCQLHSSGSLSFCCSLENLDKTTTVEPRKTAAHSHHIYGHKYVCGEGEPLVIGNATIMCVKGDPYSCPAEYTCHHHTATNAQYCCKFNATSSSTVSSVTPPSSAPSMDREGCPAPLYPARDPYGRAMTCTLNNRIRSCPSDYNCTYSEAYSRFQCCGSRPVPLPSTTPASSTVSGTSSTRGQTPVISQAAPMSTPESISTTIPPKEDLCPVGQRAFKDASTNVAKSCIVNTPGNCPAGYFCQFSSQANRFLCCGVHAGCPANAVAFINPSTGLVQTCNNTDDASAACPSNYHCATTPGGRKVCCSGEERLCQSGEPLLHQGAVKVRSCSLSHPCPDQWACLPSRAGSVCCPKPSQKSGEILGR